MLTGHFPADAAPKWHQPVLALGNFDGLHRGHMKIIDRVRRRAGERGGTPGAMTFDPHPARARGTITMIASVRRAEGERGGAPAAMTFDPHPSRVLRPDKAPPLLMTIDQ